MNCPLDIVLIFFREISPWSKEVKGLSLTKCPSFDKCSLSSPPQMSTLPPPPNWAPSPPQMSTLSLPSPMCAHPQCHYIKQVPPFNKQSTSSLTFLKSRNTRVTCFYCHYYNFASFKYKGISTGWLFLNKCPPPPKMKHPPFSKCSSLSFLDKISNKCQGTLFRKYSMYLRVTGL